MASYIQVSLKDLGVKGIEEPRNRPYRSGIYCRYKGGGAMIPYLGWILFAYGMAAATVHMIYRLDLRKRSNHSVRVNYVLVTHNHENQMEWYVRALSWYGRLRGLSLNVTVLDVASEDDTLAILQRLHNQEGLELKIVGISEVHEEDIGQHMIHIMDGNNTPVYVDLRVPQEASKLPYVHV
ncbi:hypothetical protein D3C74_167440 [compost metagenome]